jgi:hypothetical protein
MTDDNNLPGNEPGPDVAPVQSADDYEGRVAEIADLIGDQFDTDPSEDEAAPEEATAQADAEDDDPLGLNDAAEDVANAQDAEDGDGPQEDYAGGRFAADDAKTRLADGRVISVADLKSHAENRIKEFQRDYTEKTTALKAEKAQVDQRAQSLDQFQEYAAWYAEQFLPKQPEPFKGDPNNDPMGYMKWLQERDRWAEHAQAYQQFKAAKDAENQTKQQETQTQAQQRLETERAALIKAIPALKDPVKGKQVWDTIRMGAIQHYGLTAEEFDTIGDHRILVGLRDALAYRRIKEKAPQVQAQVNARPAMKPARRQPPQAAASKERTVRSERLRSTGRMDAAVASLMDIDL